MSANVVAGGTRLNMQSSLIYDPVNDGAHLSQSRIQSSGIFEYFQQSVILLQSTPAPALYFELIHIANRFLLGTIPDAGLPDAREDPS
jgi:hypothetical protein